MDALIEEDPARYEIYRHLRLRSLDGLVEFDDEVARATGVTFDTGTSLNRCCAVLFLATLDVCWQPTISFAAPKRVESLAQRWQRKSTGFDDSETL